MPTRAPEIMGRPPELAGRRCAGLVAREYWYKGELSNPACVVWIAADDQWHRLCIDTGIVFWRRAAPDICPDAPEHGYSYRLVDLGKPRGLEGLEIAGYTMAEQDGEVRVSFKFSEGRTFEVIHRDDVTRYAS